MKTCFKCGVEKEIAEFYVHKAMSDGRLNKCKECTKSDVKKHYREAIDRIKAYDIERNKTKERKEMQGRMSRTARTKYPIKFGARAIVGNAVRDGRITKPTSCQTCGKQKQLDGHHSDYAKPLDVMWLCRQCHNDWHKVNVAINGD